MCDERDRERKRERERERERGREREREREREKFGRKLDIKKTYELIYIHRAGAFL